MSFGSRTRKTAPISFGLRTRSVLGGSVLGGDDENKMQDSDLDGGDVEEEEGKKRKLGRRVIWAMGRHNLGWPELG